MQAGQLDRRVTILRRVLTRNVHGEEVESYTEAGDVWAQKLDVVGRELFSAQQTLAEGTTRFRLRWRADLYATDRLRYGTTEYDIVQIAELGRQDGLEVIATARVT